MYIVGLHVQFVGGNLRHQENLIYQTKYSQMEDKDDDLAELLDIEVINEVDYAKGF